MNFDVLNPYMFWIKLGGAALIVIAIFSSGMWLEGTIKQHEIDGLKIEQANKVAEESAAALNQFTADASLIHDAASHFTAQQADLSKKFTALSKDLNDAIKAHPLDPACRPDNARLRTLSEAVAAANKARTTGQFPNGAVPGNP